MSEIPTGSLKPDSPSSTVRGRLPALPPERSVAYTAAGSVGERATPTKIARDQSRPMR